jgi:hypothetical protein
MIIWLYGNFYFGKYLRKCICNIDVNALFVKLSRLKRGCNNALILLLLKAVVGRHVTPLPSVVETGNVNLAVSVSEASREAAARLLFACVHWARSVPALCRLPVSDQRALVTHGWSELFLLTAAQFDVKFHTSQHHDELGDHVKSRHTSGMSPQIDSGIEIRQILQFFNFTLPSVFTE